MRKTIKVKDLQVHPDNPRFIKTDQFDKLVKSIEQFPEMLDIRPIVCNKEYTVLGGNQRLRAIKKLGWKEVNVRIVDFSEEKEREFLIKDNKQSGEWDYEAIANGWDIELLDDWGLDLPEMDIFDDEQAFEDNYRIPDEIEPDVKAGDLIEIGNHRLLCGDSTKATEVEKLMAGKTFDMIMTDPPYNVDYQGGTGLKIMNDKMGDSAFYNFLLDFYKAFNGATKEGGAWYVWHADSEGVNFRKAMRDAGILQKQCLIWVKSSLVLGRQDYQWQHEPCLYGWKEGAAHYFTNSRKETTVIEDKVDLDKMKKNELLKYIKDMMAGIEATSIIRADKPVRSAEHPTMKPIELIAPLIKNSSKKGQIVGDGFLGSGSTMVAAHQLGRTCYGMELDPKYCQVIIDRMNQLEPGIEIKINGKEYQT